MVDAGARRALDALPPRNVRALLEQLVALRQRQRAGEVLEPPLVTVHLRGGQAFTGWVLLNPHDPDARAAAPDALYLEADQVVAVRVIDAVRAVAGLAPDWSGPPPGHPAAHAPGSSAPGGGVRRAGRQAVGLDSGVRDSMGDGSRRRRGTVLAAGDDEQGHLGADRDARRRPGAGGTGAALAGEALVVRCALGAGSGDQWSAGAWETAIAAVL